MKICGHEIKTTNDAAAKFVLTGKYGEKISKAYANAVLEDFYFKKMKDFKLKSPIFNPANYVAKTSIFDIKGETSNKDQFDFEIQRLNHLGFEIRIISYSGLQFTRIKKSRNYRDYPNFILIALLNFELNLNLEIQGFHDCLCYTSLVNPKRVLSKKSSNSYSRNTKVGEEP